MTAELAAKLAFLRASDAFDGVLEIVETHMSWVFLTEQRAFKLKKPVRLPYVDYRTIARRRRSCERELRLGRRLAASVYESVVPLVARRDGLAIGGAGEIVDWLVVMRRLARDRMLPEMLASGAAAPAHADAVGRLLAAFYVAAARAPWSAGEHRRRSRELATATGDELVARGAPREVVHRLLEAQLVALDRHAALLDARLAGGRVVDAHGDLRPEHVCLEDPPVVIDPLELDDDLRRLDAASELAFFALECERLDAAWFGERVLARYAEDARDAIPPELAAMYRSQHALTRALIALRHLDDAPLGERPRWTARAADYLARAVAR